MQQGTEEHQQIGGSHISQQSNNGQDQPGQIQITTSDIVSPLTSPPIPPPHIAQYIPKHQQSTNIDQGGQVLQQIHNHPLFQQQPVHQNVAINPGEQQPQGALQQPQQQYQQHLQTMLQTPILYPNSNNNNATLGTNNSPQTAVKKGRFRVVKGANDAKATTDDQSAASSVKKGRFRVVKGTNDAKATSAESAKDGKTLNPHESTPCKKVENDKEVETANVPAGKATADDKATTTKEPVIGNENNNLIPPATVQPVEAKKKGRFLVKTGASAANLQTLESEAVAGGSESKGVEVQLKADKSSLDKKGNVKTGNTDDVNVDQEVSTKKKGRFVIKTGGGATGSLTNSPGAGASATLSPPEAPKQVAQPVPQPTNMQNSGIGSANHVQQSTNNIQMPTYFAGNVHHIPTSSLVDVNGQIMVVSNMAIPIQQQHPVGQQVHVQQHFVNPPAQVAIARVQSGISSIGSQAQPPQTQPLPNFADALSRPRAATDEKAPPENVSSSKAHVPRASRPPGSSGNWASLKGKNGRLIGGGGVGKVLHHLDTMRTEIIEADRSISSLNSDNRLLRDKNKELEAKNRDLLRTLAEEKRLRHAAEVKYRSLLGQVNEQLDGNKSHFEPQLDLKPAPSQGGNVSKNVKPSHSQDGSVSKSYKAPAEEIPNKVPQTVEQNVELGTASFEDCNSEKRQQQQNTELKQQHQVNKSGLGVEQQAQSSTEKSPKPKHQISRNNSYVDTLSDAKLVESLTPASASQSMTCLSSVVNQFDPLGSTLPSTVTVQVPQVTDSQTCISAITTNNHDNVAIPIVVAATTASAGEMQCATNINSKTATHFDPLGTPERPTTGTVEAMVINGLPQMPITGLSHKMNDGNNVTVPFIVPILHHQPKQQEQKTTNQDPFDEIVKNNRGM